MVPERLAFVCPRFAGEGAVGGAETLLKNLATHAAACGYAVDFLTTCAQSHYTWENTLPPGRKSIDGMGVHFFPVDERDTAEFLRLQQAIDRGRAITPDEELRWLRNGVCSSALMEYLDQYAADYRAIITGPYLFGLAWFAAMAHRARTLVVPCLHDEPFARLACMRRLFTETAGCLFNSQAERELAGELFEIPDAKAHIVGMGLDPFEVDPGAFAKRHGLTAPYVLYAGRREPLKGTPLLCDYMASFRERTGRDVKLVFTGSGTIDAPATLWPHILDVGFVSEQEKHEAMAGAVAFIHPSVNESFGIVLLEAFLAGTPGLVHANSRVLVSQCRAANAGLWFRHYPDFEAQLLFLLDHPEARAELGQRGRDFVTREYAWPAIEQKFIAALNDLCPVRLSAKPSHPENKGSP
ncbi:MAG: glycosyltransferase family 4 protein [Kiritimatiellia bacterium]|jgi:glycosyltransferase involved in cell wall biosynthesis|nr:glycosyltransferase family 4 protein [Kiritimatiellia bacterium]